MHSATDAPTSELQAVRREHLLDALSGPWTDIEAGAETEDALTGGECPRYLIRSHDEPEDWDRFRLVDDLDEAAAGIRDDVMESPAWWPSAVVDLDRGEELDFRLDIAVCIARPCEREPEFSLAYCHMCEEQKSAADFIRIGGRDVGASVAGCVDAMCEDCYEVVCATCERCGEDYLVADGCENCPRGVRP